MRYDKPHLAYDAQVRLLRSRGMDVGNEADAVRALKRVGYYRLSAYSYPMRQTQLDELGEICRLDFFVEGAKLSDAVALHDFDHKLRRSLLSAIQTLEVAVRVKVGYHLGKHGSLSHLDGSGLDKESCATINKGPDHTGTRYESWLREYESLQNKARDEDYVKHFTENYDGRVPVWAATEFMTMGCLISLYKLMRKQDAKRIAHELGVKSQMTLFSWLKPLNVLRNHCAHNARVWNRSTVYPPKKINKDLVSDDLYHLSGADNHKVYYLAAVLGHLLKSVDACSPFPDDFKTTMRKFPTVLGWTPENTMGFPEGWASQALWTNDRRRRS